MSSMKSSIQVTLPDRKLNSNRKCVETVSQPRTRIPPVTIRGTDKGLIRKQAQAQWID